MAEKGRQKKQEAKGLVVEPVDEKMRKKWKKGLD